MKFDLYKKATARADHDNAKYNIIFLPFRFRSSPDPLWNAANFSFIFFLLIVTNIAAITSISKMQAPEIKMHIGMMSCSCED